MNIKQEKENSEVDLDNQREIAIAVTLIGGIKDDIKTFKESVKEGMIAIKDNIREVKDILKEEYVKTETFNGLKENVVTMQDNNKWLWRTITATIITFIITMAFTFLQKP